MPQVSMGMAWRGVLSVQGWRLHAALRILLKGTWSTGGMRPAGALLQPSTARQESCHGSWAVGMHATGTGCFPRPTCAPPPNAPPGLHALDHILACSCTCLTPIQPLCMGFECPTGVLKALAKLQPPKWLFRSVACIVLGGQVIVRICKGGFDGCCLCAWAVLGVKVTVQHLQSSPWLCCPPAQGQGRRGG